NIVLVGFMGTGKTVVGKALAESLGFRYIDTDLMVEADAHMPISRIFELQGEPAFRNLEAQAILRTTHLTRFIISTGGGAVISDQNIENMKKAGLVVCLTAEPEIIYERTKSDKSRPLLQTPDPRKKIQSLLNIRAPQYQKADVMIDTSHLAIPEVVRKILDEWQKYQ
ncbi:MAG TPA: shikimate kinase, partial [Candidatus Sumerlaeota bacterium]|nr:shikimate kinase [Candidatus Sumerlaeota bacterium]